MPNPLSFFSNLAITLIPVAAMAELRPLSTDRPDTTESPYTVDRGHFQFEMEVANWSQERSKREYALAELNAKIGLDDSKDLQLVLPFYQHGREGAEGFGDIELRMKWNLWGNDTTDSTAFAVMPFLKIPTAHGDLGNDEYEGGVILPFAFDGPAEWSFGTQLEIDLNAGENGGHHFAGLASFTASHDLTTSTAAFFELVGMLSADLDSDAEAYFNTGMTWAVSPTWQVDGGIRTGLTRASTDFTPFLGLSVKF